MSQNLKNKKQNYHHLTNDIDSLRYGSWFAIMIGHSALIHSSISKSDAPHSQSTFHLIITVVIVCQGFLYNRRDADPIRMLKINNRMSLIIVVHAHHCRSQSTLVEVQGYSLILIRCLIIKSCKSQIHKIRCWNRLVSQMRVPLGGLLQTSGT